MYTKEKRTSVALDGDELGGLDFAVIAAQAVAHSLELHTAHTQHLRRVERREKSNTMIKTN